jgi:phosphoribosylamine--glycine ligase
VNNKKIAILGSGGREHALAWKFAQSVGVDNVYTLPGNDGIPNSHNIDISNFDEIRKFCQDKKIDLIFVGPEQPLSDGIVDYFKNSNIRILGPEKRAAQLESSKIFAKKFMKKYGVSTARFHVFNNIADTKDLIKQKKGNLVIKFDGLAGGKGVFVCSNENEAWEALDQLEKKYGNNFPFIIEDKIPGDEISIIGFTDGKKIKTLQTSQDHKQLLEGDNGPNTGGMGAYTPIALNPELEKKIEEKVILPTLKGIKKENFDYKGVIYFGIMIKKGEPYLLEYNVRFGDPETEVLLPALKTDLYEISKACLNQELDKIEMEFIPGYFADIVLVSGSYPFSYDKGKKITGLEKVAKDILIFHAGTKKEKSNWFTNGGRILNIVGHGASLDQALKKALDAVEKINFEGKYFRRDIGKRNNPELQ